MNSSHVTQHGPQSSKTSADKSFVKTESALTEDEYMYLFNAGPDRVFLPNFRVTMSRLFHSNSRIYGKALMECVMMKGHVAFTGNDTDSMHKFFKHGLEVKARPGGVFEYEFCSASLKLTR